jgi:hypothetical protein
MTFAIALILFAVLMIYCGIKGRSLKGAILGHAVAGSEGQVAGA